MGKVTKFQFSCFIRLGAAFKKPEGPPVRLGLNNHDKVSFVTNHNRIIEVTLANHHLMKPELMKCQREHISSQRLWKFGSHYLFIVH